MVERRIIRSLGLLPVVVLVVGSLGHAAAQTGEAGQGPVETQAATSPALYYPGYAGGGIFHGGKLCCSRTVCPKNWRSSCNGLNTAACRNKACQTVTAPDGSVCDVNPCVQGLCWQGVCMGGGPATCPSHPEECMQYKCNPKTGQCRESCPKPNGTPCKGGTCKCGKCIPDPHTCPPQPNACSIYVFNNATMKCDLVNATCQQPPNSCKELRCNPSTGLCTVVVNKPDNTTCPSGSCQGGECKPERICPSPCPPHPESCKAFACNTTSGQCSIVVNKPNNTTCPGGTCLDGICKPAIKCPPSCPTHPNPCKERQCDLNTGKCSIVVDRPDNTTCPNGTCQSGSCKPATCPSPCPPHPDSCQAFACNTTSGQCSIVVNKPNNTTCPNGSCQSGSCKPVCPTCPTHPDDCKLFTCNATTAQCTNVENRPDGTLCPAGQCLNGTCTPDLICPVNPDPCQRYVLTPDGRNCTLIVDPDGTTCNDRRRCTTDDKCVAGICTGTPITCPRRTRDFRQCVESVCDEATGTCVDVQSPDGTNCTDGSLCTTNDVCVGGVCKGTPVVCALAANPCKRLVCNPLTGTCESQPINDGASCDDGQWCTINSVCVAGQCLGSARPCPDPPIGSANQCKQAFCNETAQQCSFTNRPDGTICDAPGTGRCSVDTCIAGTCVPGTRVDCSDLDDECNTGVCQTATGLCAKVPKPNTTPCDDGRFCTEGSTCTAGVCSGGRTKLCPSPKMFCTEPYCSEALRQCLLLPKDCSGAADECNAGVCSFSSGQCEKEPDNEGDTCNDGNKCTEQDTCSGGTCSGKPVICPAPASQCQTSVCDPSTGGCKIENKPDNSSCSLDGGSSGKCRSDRCLTGQCVAGPEADCSGLDDDCNVGECNPDTGSCIKRPRGGSNIPCSTGLFCTVNQICNNGTCGGGRPRVCNSTSLCQTLQCNEASNACDIVIPKDCSQFNGQCTEGRCNPSDGKCFAAIVNETKPCDDGRFCTSGTVCQSGRCTGGTTTQCTPGSKCETAVCNELLDECVSTPKTCPGTDCMFGLCDANDGNCYTVPKPLNTTCVGPTPCPGLCGPQGTCIEQCIIPPPTTCTSQSQCGAGKCCCDSTCVDNPTGDCDYTCANTACQKKVAAGRVCNCIHDCDGSNCSSAGGNPCKKNGVCCCNKASQPGKVYEDACHSCQEPCKGSGKCTGNFPPWAACQKPIG